VLQCAAVRCTIPGPQCKLSNAIVSSSSAYTCVVACCSVLQCVAVCCSALHHWDHNTNAQTLSLPPPQHTRALQHVAVCCSVLQRVAPYRDHNKNSHAPSFPPPQHTRVLQHVAVCCSVLQCVAARCSALHHTGTTIQTLIRHCFFLLSFRHRIFLIPPLIRFHIHSALQLSLFLPPLSPGKRKNHYYLLIFVLEKKMHSCPPPTLICFHVNSAF